jgi:hypothetical protein
MSNPHTVIGMVAFNASTAVVVAFPGATFSSGGSYVCTVTAVGGSSDNRYGVSYTTPSTITITSNASTSETVAFICIGN